MDLSTTAQLLGNLGEFLGSIVVLGTVIYSTRYRLNEPLAENSK